MRLSPRLAFPLLGVLAISACKDDSPPPPSAVVAITSTALAGTVGESVGTLTVKVTDAGGGVVSGVPVVFAVAEGGGTVAPAADTTDNSGLASTTWRLGQQVVAQRVTATAQGVTGNVSFVATASAGAPATIAVQAGDNQTAVAGAAVATAPSVVLRDRFNNPVPGVSVFFTVSAGGGSITGSGATTNANGVAAVTEWRLGPGVGANRLSALAVFNGVTGNPITFNATATQGSAAIVTAQNTTTINGTVGAMVTPVPQVRVTDAGGNPVSGASVTFAASAGSNVVGGTKTTDANGLAAPDGWQLGNAAQNYTLTATVGSLSAVVFTATARPGTVAQVAISAGNNQSAVVGRTVTTEPAVRVSDALNNPIAGVEVLFEVVSGGGTAVGRRPVTNAQGIATVGGWTLGDDIGANSLRATVQAAGTITGNPVIFNATATPGTPTSITAISSTNQTATVGTLVPVAPSVVIRDNRGNPVSGITVSFSIGSGNGTVQNGTVVTSNAGIATVGGWTLGTIAGAQTLIARIANLPDVVFSATATAGAASVVQINSTQNLGNVVVAAGQGAASLPSVRVTDAAGNPIAGVQVTFALGNNNSGTISGETQTTNASGVATLTSWTLPTTVGIASVVATVQGLTGVTFTATMIPAAASRIVNSGTPTNWSIGTNGANITTSFRLQDQFGNNVALSNVALTLTFSGGSPGAAVLNTQSDGSASVQWAPGAPGTYTITVTGPGLTQAIVTVVVIA
jgi:adhesin/invasin